MIAGILLVLLAFWVSGSDRVYALAQRSYLILFWVGFFALFRGFAQIMLAFGIRHAGKEAGGTDGAQVSRVSIDSSTRASDAGFDRATASGPRPRNG